MGSSLWRSAAMTACVVWKIAPGYPKVFYRSVQTLLQFHEAPRWVRPSQDTAGLCSQVDTLSTYCMHGRPGTMPAWMYRLGE
jgi:hypothetical protein